MAVDEAGQDGAAGGVENAVGGGRGSRADLRDRAVHRQHPSRVGAPAADDGAGADQQLQLPASSWAAAWTASKMRT